MAVPPEIAAALAAKQGAGAAPPMPAAGMPMGGAPKPPGPSAAPMMAPQPKQGNLAGARADIQVTIKKLTQTLQTFAPGTKEGDAVMKALSTLTKAFGEKIGRAHV